MPDTLWCHNWLELSFPLYNDSWHSNTCNITRKTLFIYLYQLLNYIAISACVSFFWFIFNYNPTPPPTPKFLFFDFNIYFNICLWRLNICSTDWFKCFGVFKYCKFERWWCFSIKKKMITTGEAINHLLFNISILVSGFISEICGKGACLYGYHCCSHSTGYCCPDGFVCSGSICISLV